MTGSPTEPATTVAAKEMGSPTNEPQARHLKRALSKLSLTRLMDAELRLSSACRGSFELPYSPSPMTKVTLSGAETISLNRDNLLGINYRHRMRKVFFSFHYGRDSWRVSQVRNSNMIGEGFVNPYFDRAGWESVKAKGDATIRAWIDTQIKGTSVTVVLVGAQTSTRRWVKYEIQKTLELGHGLIGIDISKIRNQNGATDSTGANPLPAGHKYYRWNNDDGRANLGTWIEQAARRV